MVTHKKYSDLQRVSQKSRKNQYLVAADLRTLKNASSKVGCFIKVLKGPPIAKFLKSQASCLQNFNVVMFGFVCEAN